MRYYPSADCWFYWEKLEPYEDICRYPAEKRWFRELLETETKGFKFINYWRDIEQSKIPIVLDKHLFFKEWPTSRRFPKKTLPVLYCTGPKFIKLTQAPPNGFLYAKKPVNLKVAREIAEEEAKKNKRKWSVSVVK